MLTFDAIAQLSSGLQPFGLALQTVLILLAAGAFVVATYALSLL